MIMHNQEKRQTKTESLQSTFISNDISIINSLDGWLGLWCLTPLSNIFQLYRGGQFYCGGNRSTQRKPPTCRKKIRQTITES